MPWLSIHEDLTSPFETRRPGQIEVGAVVAESELSRGHVVHATTVVERTYNVSTARAFEQWCQPDAHHIWHLPAEGWVVAASDRDVVPGGRDFCRRAVESGQLLETEPQWAVDALLRQAFVISGGTGEAQHSSIQVAAHL